MLHREPWNIFPLEKSFEEGKCRSVSRPPSLPITKLKHCGLVVGIKINIALGWEEEGDDKENLWRKRLSVPTLLNMIN